MANAMCILCPLSTLIYPMYLFLYIILYASKIKKHSFAFVFIVCYSESERKEEAKKRLEKRENT